MRKELRTRGVLLCMLLIAAGMPCALRAQIKTITAAPVSALIRLDTLPVAVFTLTVRNNEKLLVPGKDFTIDSTYTVLSIFQAEAYDSLKIQFQTLPDWLFQEQFHRRPDFQYMSPNSGPAGGTDHANDESDVVTDGVLLRGISFGNAQDLVLNSNLNLRMHGRVSKDIEIEGAVTDQEYPFQPEGTTTTLQDFDRIYVALHLPHISVLLGDYPFQSSGSARFMKYNKKNRGLQLTGTDSLKGRRLNWEATAALARGRFSRNELNGVEGLQGPYRLTGARGEQFVIVVSGTEVVYLDGARMERGLQSDYVIDYNTGEITFTPRHIINAFSRIVVEFQYSDRFYSRAISGAHVEETGKKADWFAAVYNEQDMRNQPIQQDLEAYDSASGRTAREILQQSGDNVAAAILPGVRKLPGFSSTEPNYVRRDTGSVTFYEYTANEDTFSAFYRISFSYTGPGNGTYVLTGTAANGKVFRYVGYTSGIPAGDYEPVTPLQAPNRLSMAEAGVNVHPGKNTRISTNIAVSQNDRNLFSGKDDGNNNGMAGWLQIQDLRNLGGRDSANQWYLKTDAQVEQTSANFTSIERYRNVEFGREWNRSLFNPENGLQVSSSGFGTGGMELGRGTGLAIFSRAGVNRSQGLNATFVKGGIRYLRKYWFVTPEAEHSEGTTTTGKNDYNRREINWGIHWKKNKLSSGIKQEQSRYDNTLMELLPQSYGFRQADMKLEHGQGLLNWNLFAGSRVNQQISSLALKDAVLVNNGGGEITSKLKNGYLRLNLTYRSMKLLDTVFRNSFATENHAAGRLEYNFDKLFRLLSGNVYYQSISGREQQRQYSYFEVPAGQGFYTWVDFNGNGIREVNEFQETQFRDQAKYVRLLIPTGTYIKAQSTEFNGNVLLKPTGKTRKTNWQNRITWNYTGKSAAAEWRQKLLPFTDSGSNPFLLAFQSYMRNLAELSGNSGKWVVQYTVQKRDGKVLFTNGFDYRNSLSHQGFVRLNPGRRWQIKWTGEMKKSSYTSEYVPVNNFAYSLESAEPSVTFQPSTRFRIGGFGKYGHYHNGSMLIAELKEGGLQFNRALGKGGMLEIKSSVLQAAYKQQTGTAMSYDILQGFSQGRNFRIVADLRFNAGKNVQLVVSYEGRKTGDVKMVHIGRAEARYLF